MGWKEEVDEDKYWKLKASVNARFELQHCHLVALSLKNELSAAPRSVHLAKPC